MTIELDNLLKANNIETLRINEIEDNGEGVLTSVLFINDNKAITFKSDMDSVLLNEIEIHSEIEWINMNKCFENSENKLPIGKDLFYDIELLLFELIDTFYMTQEIEDFNVYLGEHSFENTFFRFSDQEYSISDCQGMTGDFYTPEILGAFMFLLVENEIDEIFIFNRKSNSFQLFDLERMNELLEKIEVNTQCKKIIV